MFRKMRREKQQLTHAECIEILKNEPRGVLSVLGDDGYPYGIPLNHWYCEEDGKLYFHCAREGHKLDAIANCDKVSFCVYDSGFRKQGEWALNIKSVVVFGRMSIVEDHEKTIEQIRRLGHKYTSDDKYIEDEIRRSAPKVLCLVLTPVHMTGKLVKEA